MVPEQKRRSGEEYYFNTDLPGNNRYRSLDKAEKSEKIQKDPEGTNSITILCHKRLCVKVFVIQLLSCTSPYFVLILLFSTPNNTSFISIDNISSFHMLKRKESATPETCLENLVLTWMQCKITSKLDIEHVEAWLGTTQQRERMRLRCTLSRDCNQYFILTLFLSRTFGVRKALKMGLGSPTRLERLVAAKPTNMALIISDGLRMPL